MTSLDALLPGVDKRALYYADIRVMPRTEAELYSWVKNYFGWQLARRNVCPGHQSPLSVLADLVFERVLDVIILANRNGGKTLSLAVANVIDSLFKEKCEIASVGAVLAQAKKCYSYFSTMLGHELLADEALYLTESLSQLRNGSEVRVLPGTWTGVNAPHPHKARADEVELIDWDILQQFFSMARSERGIAGQNVLASTRKSLFGSMQRLMDKVEKDRSFPFVVRQWCLWESLAQNPKGGPDCQCKGIFRSDGKSFYDACQGKCRESDGFYDLRDSWRKFAMLDPEVWDSEWECLRPAKKGVIYKSMPDERFCKLHFDPKLETWGCLDFGFTHPFAFLLCQNDTQDNVYVLREIYARELEPTAMVERVAELFEELGLDRSRVTLYPDPRGAAEVAQFKKAGFKMKPKAIEVLAGINWVKKWVVGFMHPKLFVDPEMCPNLKWEMTQGYMRKPNSELPMEANDDASDALRYGICGHYPIRQGSTGGAEVPVSGGDPYGREKKSTIETRESGLAVVHGPSPYEEFLKGTRFGKGGNVG